MHLNRLSLINFKNIAHADIELSPRINCFVGDNGGGKTNILDAINYLSLCKSAFNTTDNQSIKHETDFFVIDGTFETSSASRQNIVCSLKRGATKCISRNGKEYERLSDHIGLLPLVIITPCDTSLINESGDERRKYLNTLISQLDREYLSTLIRYNHLISERNKLLKIQSTRNFGEIMEVINMQLVTLGNVIHNKRATLIETLSPLVSKYYSILSSDEEPVSLSYRSELNDTPYEQLLRESEQKDMALMFTSSGVHRDDVRMSIGGYPLRKFGSQGQQKSFLIALKLAQYEIIALGVEQPMLLLDDIFDKLDARRVEQLLTIVKEPIFGQIFITDCNKVRLEDILRSNDSDYTLFNVSNGDIQST